MSSASVCRAFVQHRPITPWKVWYTGSMFRYEKPQRGRYRQFDQVGIEVLGADDPNLDVEVIALGWEFYKALGLQQVNLLLNSLGEPDDRARYVQALKAHFEANLDALSPESRTTLEKNPLRVLDSKREQDGALIAAAPRIAPRADHGQPASPEAAAEHTFTAIAEDGRLRPLGRHPHLEEGAEYEVRVRRR